jgi:hypothetical protein
LEDLGEDSVVVGVTAAACGAGCPAAAGTAAVEEGVAGVVLCLGAIFFRMPMLLR